MKPLPLCCCVLTLALTADGGIIYSSTSGTIPDGNPVGWSATAAVSDLLPSITAVTVNLNISGGYNGDLYAYLSYGGKLLPLLNRVGVQTGNAFGYGDTGFNVTLVSSAANDVHFYGNFSPSFDGNGRLTGTWQPDGRNIDPLSTPDKYYSPDSARVGFETFNGRNPNGTWTIFFADLSSGAQSQLLDWSLNISAEVPEPVNVALGVFGGIFLVVTVVRSRPVRNWVHHRRVAIAAWISDV